MTNIAALIPIFPLVGFLINGFFGKKINNEKIIGSIASIAVAIPFLISCVLCLDIFIAGGDFTPITAPLFTWLKFGNIDISIAYQIDQLSILFSLIVTGIGFLIHIYSIGYMHGDRSFYRFFAYLNLFIFMMLNLVLADNFLLTFLGWEGVGLCSYLLIGFWYDRKFDGINIIWTGDAGKKAFITNRIGDFGFLVAMFIIFANFGSLNYIDINHQLQLSANDLASSSVIFWAALALFLGCCGKSAQLPLSVWLPDAMAGPTPVSALIHAATMVTAGIYLIARNSLLFALTPEVMTIVAIVGIITALWAATIGLVQNDIKKVLAYSTVSQLGFMFAALGVGAFSAGVFHVMTHAFFKGLLFLGAGSVIHGMHEEQNIHKMGNLRKYMPTTYKTFMIATLAIAGVPFFSGFFSKDEIMWSVYNSGTGGVIGWLVLVLAAFCTAFYMFRLTYLVFYGSERFDINIGNTNNENTNIGNTNTENINIGNTNNEDTNIGNTNNEKVHPHESPKVMTLPLVVLAILSAFGGFVGVPYALGFWASDHPNMLANWLSPIFANANTILRNTEHEIHNIEYLLIVIAITIALLGIYLAAKIYKSGDMIKSQEIAISNKRSNKFMHKLFLNKYYLDECIYAVIINPIVAFSQNFVLKLVDIKIIDGIINNLARLFAVIANVLRYLQTGIMHYYAALVVVGIIFVLSWLFFI